MRLTLVTLNRRILWYFESKVIDKVIDFMLMIYLMSLMIYFMSLITKSLMIYLMLYC